SLIHTCVCTCALLLTDPATTGIYTLSLHDALPILWRLSGGGGGAGIGDHRAIHPSRRRPDHRQHARRACPGTQSGAVLARFHGRSEEHTSELQSRENLVCRLLLEKKNTHPPDRQKA